MAPAIVHFLVGASILLLAATPLAYRYDLAPWWPPWLIVGGGLWGLFPDVHHVAPVSEAGLRSLHDARRADLFAAHYSLDRPAVRALYVESVFASILLFCVAVTVFTLAGALGAREPRSGSPPVERDRTPRRAGGNRSGTSLTRKSAGAASSGESTSDTSPSRESEVDVSSAREPREALALAAEIRPLAVAGVTLLVGVILGAALSVAIG